jgi:hypothetical protein
VVRKDGRLFKPRCDCRSAVNAHVEAEAEAEVVNRDMPP